MKKLLPIVAAALLIGTPAHAQGLTQGLTQVHPQGLTQGHPQDQTTEIDRIFSWATPATPGCAVAVSQHGELVVNRAYGSADLERDVPISPDTVFDVGSVTKQFVAAAVLLLVEEGQVSRSEDVRTYIPELPETGHRVTVDQLLTHTGGVRDWTGILPLAAAPADALTITLRQRGLNFAPGEEISYSNSGYVLLKEIVARTSGTSFGEFARRRLFEPLGMTATDYRHDLRDVVKNRALAYEQEDSRWRLDVLLDDARGGGGALLSTVGDLLIWNDALTRGRLGAFVTETIHEPARLNNGRALGYARGLFLDTNRGGRVVWHTGSAAGYKALLSRYPEQGLSIAVLCNAGEIANTTGVARRIFDLFVPATGAGSAGSAAAGTPAAVAQGVGGAGPDLNGKAGLFFSEGAGEPLRLIVERDTLRFAGGPALVPVTGERFRSVGASLQFMSQDEVELHISSPDQIELTSMEGKTTTYRRARPYAPTVADLEAFAGRYESDEIGSAFQVAAGERGLMVRLAHAPGRALEMRPVAPDTFQAGMVTLRFRRDVTGNVVSLGYSSPVLRDVPFTRLSDRTGQR